MPNNWKTYKFEELYLEPSRNGVSKPKSVRGIGFKMVNMGEIFKYSFISNQVMDRVQLTDVEYNKSMLAEGDLLFARQSLVASGVGKCILVNELNEETTFESHLIRVRLKNAIAYPKFIYYKFQSQNIRNIVISLSNGVAAHGIKGSDLQNIELELPPIQEQKSIASILSAIDDKIENNLAINKTLEEMAMALYKHWFVDFGPFHDGEFVESELGRIPKGWEVKRFFELFELLSGGTPKTSVKEYWNGEVSWVSAKDIGSNNTGLYINETEKKITELGVEKSAAKLLPEDTVIVVARGSVGKYGMITKPMAMNQSCYGIYSKSTYSQPLTYLLIQSLMNHFMQVSYGSVFDTITTSTFKGINVLLPPKNVLNELKEPIDDYFYQIKENIKENQTLTQLRDTLLPKLISGELRLKEFQES